MKKKLVSVIMSLMMVFAPVYANAQEAESEITSLDKGETAPYSGILLNIPAAVKINTDKKYSLLEYELKLDLEVKKITAQHQLTFGNLQAKYDSLSEQHGSIMSIKDEELSRLQELIKNDPNDYTMWWFGGGVALGVVLSIAIFYAAVETAK
mgnify:CR=1 FL=1|tara:strand:+ start:228 stop:683 length:456 start_codon:yes stop_codon:yes gene_type:complete